MAADPIRLVAQADETGVQTAAKTGIDAAQGTDHGDPKRRNLADLRARSANLNADASRIPGAPPQNTNSTAETSYDSSSPQKGSRFNFDTLQGADRGPDLGREPPGKTYEMAYGDHAKNIRQIGAHAGDDSAWMAFPSEGRRP